ncbi:hypothetical protein PHET_09034 [Paragonimus heterotremus]|uniref:Uncharacterized protein n=1 Tax=Paragonimus heterotremus TaxID=100268 RepID=A0A8J4WF84_9TREM|nr:hypothetical protein PHET_09034 [Paragonimus heterotremus]
MTFSDSATTTKTTTGLIVINGIIYQNRQPVKKATAISMSTLNSSVCLTVKSSITPNPVIWRAWITCGVKSVTDKEVITQIRMNTKLLYDSKENYNCYFWTDSFVRCVVCVIHHDTCDDKLLNVTPDVTSTISMNFEPTLMFYRQ